MRAEHCLFHVLAIMPKFIGRRFVRSIGVSGSLLLIVKRR